jgi:hypothetical protein
LRISRGKGFQEIIYQGSKHPYDHPSDGTLCDDITYSEFYLLKLRELLLNNKDAIAVNFMNSVFNSLNDVTSELFLVMKEESPQ